MKIPLVGNMLSVFCNSFIVSFSINSFTFFNKKLLINNITVNNNTFMCKLQLNIILLLTIFKLKYDINKALTMSVINFNKFLSIFIGKPVVILNRKNENIL